MATTMAKQDLQKNHPKSHGSIVSQYLQKSKIKSYMNADYYSDIPRSHANKQKIQKINQIVE